MKIVENSDERLVIEAGDALFAVVLGALALGFGAWAAAMLIQRPGAIATERVIGLLGGSGVFLVAFLALYERARFEFDRRRRMLTWRRRRVPGTRSGSVSFDRVRAVLVQVTVSGRTGTQPKWRLALALERDVVPVSVAYAPDGKAEVLGLSETVRRFIGLPVTDPFVAQVAAELRKGNRAEAVRLVHEERHVGREAAERFVDELASSGA